MSRASKTAHHQLDEFLARPGPSPGAAGAAPLPAASRRARASGRGAGSVPAVPKAVKAAAPARSKASGPKPSPPNGARGLPPEESLEQILLQVVRIPNPQYADKNGAPGESAIWSFCRAWLEARGLRVEASLEWGLHAVVGESGRDGGGGGGVLLGAHLDSDHLEPRACAGARVVAGEDGARTLVADGEVGLDDQAVAQVADEA